MKARVAADFSSITHDRDDLGKAVRNVPVGSGHGDLAVIEFHIRQNAAGAEMCFKSKNGIANVIEMRRLRFVENNAVLELARISHDYSVSDDDIFAHVPAAADMAILSDPGRPFQYCALLDNRAPPHKNVAADESPSPDTAQHPPLST